MLDPPSKWAYQTAFKSAFPNATATLLGMNQWAIICFYLRNGTRIWQTNTGNEPAKIAITVNGQSLRSPTFPNPPLIVVISQSPGQLMLQRPHSTWQPEWICKHLTEQLQPEISNISEVYMTKSLAWQLSLNAGLPWSVPSVRWSPGHFGMTRIGFRAPTEIEVCDYRLESAVQNRRFPCCWDHRLGPNKSDHGPNHGESTDLHQNARQSSNDPSHRWPMGRWSVWVLRCEGKERP